MILVTGGTGLVGSHLLFWLTKEHATIRALYRTESSIDSVKHVFGYYTDEIEPLFSKIEWVKADITNIVSMDKFFNGITKVYHVAALVSFNPKDYYNMRKSNIEGTANIVNLCIEKGVQKLCYVSSIATLEKSSQSKLVTEESEWNPESNNYGYAITKYGAEMEVWRASQEGLTVVMVNPGVILGPGYWNQGTGELFNKAFNNFPFYTEGVTGFVGVNDVVKAMTILMESDICNERFILVSENKSFKEIIFLIADNLKSKRPYIKVTKILAELAWMTDFIVSKLSGKAVTFSRQSARASLNIYEYSSEKIINKVDFKFEQMEQVIKESCSFYLKDKSS